MILTPISAASAASKGAVNALWWWIDRWRKSTAFMDMTLEQQGAYRNLLDEATLRGGPLPNDERVLAKACGDARAWKRVGAIVMARFELHEDGWHHETLDAVIHQSARRAANQANYRSRRNNTADNGGSNEANNKPASPYPDLSKEKKEHTHTPRERERFGPTIIGNEHRAHAACGRICVPAFLHRQFKDALGGQEREADDRLRNWYDWVFDQLPMDAPVPTDAGKFWRPLFDAEFVAAKPTVEVSLQAHADGMREILRKQGAL